MKRQFALVICAFFLALASAPDTRAQSGRKRTAPPVDERAGKSETKDEAKGKAKGEAKEEAGDKLQDGAREEEEDDARPRTARELATRAVLRVRPNPKYPVGAREYGVRGVVKLRIILGADGRVGDKIEVLEGLPHGVTEEAIKAARRIKFDPARLQDGRPVSQYVIVFYHFNLY